MLLYRTRRDHYEYDMDNSSSSFVARVERELASLKIVSRLIGHELRAQSGQRVTLSRDSLMEIQTSIDLFIEEVYKNRSSTPLTAVDTEPVSARTSRMN